MAASEPSVIERFAPSAGRSMGVGALAVLTVAMVLVVAWGGVADQLGALMGLATAALLCWIALVRPAVHARDDHLLLRNLVRDTQVPWHLVDQVRIAQTLRVQVGEAVHHGVAIGRSARSDMRAQRQVVRKGATTLPDYGDYVKDRITRLATERSSASVDRPAVTHRWAWVELVAGVLLVVADVVLALT